MAIEKQYLDMIEEIKQNDDKLSDFEKGFIYGDNDSSAIDTRESLSFKQKALIERIFKERVEGVAKDDIREIKYNNNRIVALKTETNAFKVCIDSDQIGPDVSQSEAAGIVGWLSETIEELKPAAGFPGE